MVGAAGVIVAGFEFCFLERKREKPRVRREDRQCDRREEKRGEERRRGKWREMKAIDSQCVHRKAMRRSLIPRLLSAVITISHCWREM